VQELENKWEGGHIQKLGDGDEPAARS